MYLYWTFSERDYNTSVTVSVKSASMYHSTVNEWNDWHKRVWSIVNSCFCVYKWNGLNSWPVFGLWPRLQWPINAVFCFVLKPKQFLNICCCICFFFFCFFFFFFCVCLCHDDADNNENDNTDYDDDENANNVLRIQSVHHFYIIIPLENENKNWIDTT